MKNSIYKDALAWGVGLWLIGYALGFILFMFVPVSLMGWIIMPIGIVITLWVLFKRIKSTSVNYYVTLGFVWTIIAIVFDYLFLVRLLHPEDGYYKPDVYLYYGLTLLLPILVGWYKSRPQKGSGAGI